LNSPTITVGIENTARYLQIHNEAAKASLIVEKDRAYLKFSPNELLINPSRQHCEYGMTVALNTLRLNYPAASCGVSKDIHENFFESCHP